METAETNPVQIDQATYAFYLEVAGSKVVLLQAFFELYEGLGTVRTIDIRRSLICVLTTPTQLHQCREALEAHHHVVTPMQNCLMRFPTFASLS